MAVSIKDILRKEKELSQKLANEAETRKKIIDNVIEDVLGWNEDDISYEERVTEDGETTYSDYIIRTADIAILVEAKKIGIQFEQVPNKRKHRLRKPLMMGETEQAIKQARDYCRKKSIPFAVVTNGSKWIIFPAIRTDQVTFSDSNAFIFDSLQSALITDFELFESLLSRNGVIEGNLSNLLLGRNEDQLEERRLKKFIRANNGSVSNPIYPLIENAVLAAFSDSIVTQDVDILEKCYVKNADRTKFDNKIQMHLNKQEALFHAKPMRPMRKKEQNSFSDSLQKAEKNAKPLAILILGTVGTGKTTFIQYTRRIAAHSYFLKHKDKAYPHWIDIDFRTYSPEKSVYEKIIDITLDYINSDDYFSDFERAVAPAYKAEIQALKRGPGALLAKNPEAFDQKVSEKILTDYENKAPYVEKLLGNAAKSSPIFLVIDNVDQHEADETQSRIFAEAISFTSRLNINLVIAMRESTYVKHRNSPTFDAFDFDPIHVEPPEIPAVLSKRFFLAHQMLKDKSGSFTSINGADFQVSDLSVFVDIVKSSVLGTEVGEKIDVLANHDVRLALRMTREFLSRGYTDPAKALQKFNESGTYTLPKQEAFRSILLGNQSVYSEEYSPIGNPFDSRIGRTNSELLRLFVLAGLVKKSSLNGPSEMDGPTIRETLNSLGYSENDTLKVLTDLCKLRFIHTKAHRSASLTSSFFASRLGGHVCRTLLGDFTYLESVLMDTFISDREVWNQLKEFSEDIQNERMVVRRIQIRVQRTRCFYGYMMKLYSPLIEQAAMRGLDSTWLTNPLKESYDTLDENLERAIKSAKRNYG